MNTKICLDRELVRDPCGVYEFKFICTAEKKKIERKIRLDNDPSRSMLFTQRSLWRNGGLIAGAQSKRALALHPTYPFILRQEPLSVVLPP